MLLSDKKNMCGIVGGWVPGGLDPRCIEASLDTIRHRGPDESGSFVGENVFLGNRRLSIIDLESGKQPVFNEDGSIVVVFNGEIYNYLELTESLLAGGHIFRTRTDTEVLVHLYEQQGTEMCRKLRGMFAFALWDSLNRQLFVARDRFGKKPLYYSITKDRLLFASELKALRVLAHQVGSTWSVRDQGIFDYLSLGCIPQPSTIFDNVYALEPGSWMTFDGRESLRRKYWTLSYSPKTREPYHYLLDRCRNLMSEAVKLRLRSDVPLGVFLSGGMDSSIVAYEAARALGASLRTFTVRMPGSSLDESSVARRTSEYLGVQNTLLDLDVDPLRDVQDVVRVYDQPFADPSAIPSLRISKLASEHVKVVLNGDGGDELFAGYRRYLALRYGAAFSLMPGSLLRTFGRLTQMFPGNRRSLAGFAARTIRGWACTGGSRYLVWTLDMLAGEQKDSVWLKSKNRWTEELLNQVNCENCASLDDVMSMDVRVLLASDLLVKMDMAAMASSLEARSPLLDHELAEFAATLPDAYKIRFGRTKAILRNAYAGLLPEEVIRGSKRGFEPPLSGWLKHELRPLLVDTIGTPSAIVRSYVDDTFIDSLLADPDRSGINGTVLLYALLVLELWLSHWSSAGFPHRPHDRIIRGDEQRGNRRSGI
ncbi:asparagine synthase (glutamine-hydrolyzing) [Desulfomonile tiedjei]|uniref:asparagine synthase (glutamine-hydrolyzing) n=1 Tax=Desulfomonile tiedjei (strain ATCC 49306 / DSM 6799 / DCB-1) TaxID=706587 RepID=I4C7E0_DESTA|nr:asparagine synthase (glutamine-hydrolyzing) [Desulfomonile tiedjei]AFM25481.1 asparagine synthase, glutamine-hydrolyzing [Desulfomonile tiedjei DSM 6799]